jgi:hypothetical protein
LRLGAIAGCSVTVRILFPLLDDAFRDGRVSENVCAVK